MGDVDTLLMYIRPTRTIRTQYTIDRRDTHISQQDMGSFTALRGASGAIFFPKLLSSTVPAYGRQAAAKEVSP